MIETIEISTDAGRIKGRMGASGYGFAHALLEPFTKDAGQIAKWLRNHVDGLSIIDMITVHDGFVGRGYGKHLMNRFFQATALEGMGATILVAKETNDQEPGFDLRTWYRSRGFVNVTDTSIGAFMVAPAALGRAMRAELFPAYHAAESEEEAACLVDQEEAASRPAP